LPRRRAAAVLLPLRPRHREVRRGRHELSAPRGSGHDPWNRHPTDRALPLRSVANEASNELNMGSRLPLFPEQASTVAGQVDALYFFLLGFFFFFSILIAALVIFFAVKYRRRSDKEPPPAPPSDNHPLEIAWSVIPLGISMIIFWWGA